jgi:hypothetical protein
MPPDLHCEFFYCYAGCLPSYFNNEHFVCLSLPTRISFTTTRTWIYSVQLLHNDTNDQDLSTLLSFPQAGSLPDSKRPTHLLTATQTSGVHNAQRQKSDVSVICSFHGLRETSPGESSRLPYFLFF